MAIFFFFLELCLCPHLSVTRRARHRTWCAGHCRTPRCSGGARPTAAPASPCQAAHAHGLHLRHRVWRRARGQLGLLLLSSPPLRTRRRAKNLPFTHEHNQRCMSLEIGQACGSCERQFFGSTHPLRCRLQHVSRHESRLSLKATAEASRSVVAKALLHPICHFNLKTLNL